LKGKNHEKSAAPIRHAPLCGCLKVSYLRKPNHNAGHPLMDRPCILGVRHPENRDFSTAVLLFTDEHPVPHMPPVVAAVFSTSFELGCPVLLALGLGARLATLPLLVMTAIINFTYQNATEHYYWAMLLSMILFYGPGKISIDYCISKRMAVSESNY